VDCKAHEVIAANLKRVRNGIGITQEQLAVRVGVERRSIQKIESGRWNMTVDYVERMRIALGTSWNEVLKGIES
jgi:putative transcriptional regulator